MNPATKRLMMALAATVLWTTPAMAGGIFVPGYGSQAQPRAGAFVAKADDPSALFYNPAGFARQRGTTAHFGLNFIDFSQRFQRTGSYEAPQTGDDEIYTGEPYPLLEDDSAPAIGFAGFQGIPTIAVATDLGGRTPFVFGFGLIAEHGFPGRGYSAYSDDYTFEDPDVAPPPNRYDIIEQEVSIAFPSVAAAYSVGKLDVGVRFSWGIAGLKATTYLWGIRNFEEDIHKDAKFKVDVTDPFIPAAQLGLLYHVAPWFEIGAQYTSRRTLSGKGEGQADLGSGIMLAGEPDFIAPVTGADAQCEDGGTVAALRACVHLTTPQVASVGARYIVRDRAGHERGDVELDVQWEDWSAASDISIVVDGKSGLSGLLLNEALIRHGFRDTFSFRLGGSYEIPVGTRDVLTARGGVAYDTRAADQSWTRADIDGIQRTTFGAGLGYTTGRTRIDLGGGYVHEPERVVPADCNPVGTAPGCNGDGTETPVTSRTSPDPVQPLAGALNQVESPFNAGTYKQHYVLLSLGVTYVF